MATSSLRRVPPECRRSWLAERTCVLCASGTLLDDEATREFMKAEGSEERARRAADESHTARPRGWAHALGSGGVGLQVGAPLCPCSTTSSGPAHSWPSGKRAESN